MFTALAVDMGNWVSAYQIVVRRGPVELTYLYALSAAAVSVVLKSMHPTRANTPHLSPRVLLFLGAPGSGKGTQSSWLSSRLGMPMLSTGEILRSEAKRNTPAGFRLRQVLASGALVDDELVCAVVGSRLRRDAIGRNEPSRGVILDGFPRTVQQAAFLDSVLADLGFPRPCVIHLEVSSQVLLKRLTARRHCATCGAIYNLVSRPSLHGSRCELDNGALIQRDDDSEGVILRRLADYQKSCQPLVEYYADSDYHRIDGDREPEQIFEQLLEIAVPQQLLVEAYGD
jgi:adenylate kinase